MPSKLNVKIPKPEILRITDHSVFGKHVIKWALMKPELRPKTVGEIKARFESAAQAMSIPDHVTDDRPIDMAQGDQLRDLIALPPLFKLLPMLEYLGETFQDYDLTKEELGFDPSDPPQAQTQELFKSEEHYKVPPFYEGFNEAFDSPDREDHVNLFLCRVGDYSFQGCR